MRSPSSSLPPVLLAMLAGLALAAGLAPRAQAGPRARVPDAGARIAAVALAEYRHGGTEAPRGTNAGPDITRYRSATRGASSGSPWCAYFASWVARAAGHPIGVAGRGVSSSAELAGWAHAVSRWSARPEVGGLVVLPDHVGVVVAVHGSRITTVEGNWSDKVSRLERPAGGALGYVTPPTPDQPVMAAFAGGVTRPGAVSPLAAGRP